MKELRFYKSNKRERGAITLFVLLACLFFTFILTGVYISSINRLQVQEQEIGQIQDNYAKNLDRVDEIYEELAKNAVVTLRQEPANGIWTKEVTLIGNAKLDELSTATIKNYIFNQESTEDNQASWSWETVDETNVKELVDIKQEEITKNGSYYFWIKDSEGEVHRSNEVNVQNVDNNKPEAGTIIAKEQNEDGSENDYDLEKSPWTDKDVKIEKVDGTDGEGETETVYTILKDGVEYEDSIKNPLTDPTTLTETGEYTVTVITKDEAGNETEREYTIRIDKVVPILALKHNDVNGENYDGSWTKDNLYGEISIDTSTTGKEVEKYQYSENGVIWNDITGEIKQTNIDYTTTFPMDGDKPDWLSGPINNGEYYFEVQADGTLKPNNSGNNSTKAESYFEIDLTNYPDAELEITLNATISSENNRDFGYATITNQTSTPTDNSETGRFIYISGGTTTADYTTTIEGGQKYHLHIVYSKDNSQSIGQDTFIINSINLKSEKITDKINFYNYYKENNHVTFNLNEDLDKEIYIRAIYTDSATSKYGDKTAIKIDKTAPIVSKSKVTVLSEKTAKAEIQVKETGSGLKGYYISTEETEPTESSSWTEQLTNEFTIEELNTNTTYYLWVRDNVGNISNVQKIEIGNVNYAVDDKIYTETLEQAINESSDGSIIKLIKDYTDLSTVTFNKNVTLDVQNYTLTRDKTITIEAGNTVEITGTGKITISNVDSTIDRMIKNNGTLTLTNSITIENNSNLLETMTICMDDSNSITNINDEAKVIANYLAIKNKRGTVNVNGGRIEAKLEAAARSIGIENDDKLYIRNGEIIGQESGIENNSILEMTGGTVKGTRGILSMEGENNVYNGSIVGEVGVVYIGGSVTLGRQEDELSTSNPEVRGNSYGIYSYNMMGDTGNFNFYNGIIISSTEENAYNGNPNFRIDHKSYTYYDEEIEKYCTILTPLVKEITMSAEPTEYTNGDVTVTISYPDNEDIKQYSEDGITWQEAEDYIQRVVVTENRTIYARTLNASGIITDEERIEITNIDKENPIVEVTPTQTSYIVTETNGRTNINLTLTARDVGVSGLDKVQYAWTEENQEIEYIDFDSTGTTITKNNLEIGQYNLYLYVTDNAGNRADLQQIRYNVKYQEPVCKIGNTTYLTIQAAVDACSNTAGDTQTTIEMLKSTDEEFETYEGQNIILDLKGYTVGSSSIDTPLCTNNGTLQLIDSSTEKTGKLESLNGTTIENNGTFTLGDNSTSIEMEVPTVYGRKIGIENNHIFNFYDGKIQGITAILGRVTNTPEGYGPVSTNYSNGITTMQLGIVTGYEARIEWVYYTTVQEAVDATKTYQNDYRDTVTVIKDIQLTNALEINENKNLILDLDRYLLTVAEQNRVINNNGNLEITDSSIEQTGNVKNEISKSYGILNEGNLIISGGTVSSIYGIYNINSGNIDVKGGIVSGTGNSTSYGIYNNGTGTVKVSGGIVTSTNTSTYSDSYGIYNANNGKVIVEDGTVNSIGNNRYDCYGIYNAKKGIIEIIGGSVNSNNSGYNEDGYGVYNTSNGIVKVTGGIVSSEGESANYGIYNMNDGIVEITGGIISASNNDNYESCYGIANDKLGTIIIGDKNIPVNNEQPQIIGNSGRGLCNIEGETYFYNGSMQGDEPVLGSITNIREGYQIEKNTIEEKEIIYLVEKNNEEYVVQIEETRYTSLQNAINSIKEDENKTIQVIKGFELNEPIEFNKNVILDLNGYTITNNKYYRILNNNNLKIINTSSDEGKIDITNTVIGIFNLENGEIELAGGIISSINNAGGYGDSNSYGIYNVSKGNITISGGTVNSLSTSNMNQVDPYDIGDSYGIYNKSSGTVIIANGTIICGSRDYDFPSRGSYGIYNESDGNIIVSGGSVNTANNSGHDIYGIYNESKGSVRITGGLIYSEQGGAHGIYNKGLLEITGGTISSKSNEGSCGIYNTSTGNIQMTKGTVTSYHYNVYASPDNCIGIRNNGTLEITGGTVESSFTSVFEPGILDYSYGISNSGTLIIGTKGDGMVSQEEPYIKGEWIYTEYDEDIIGISGYGISNTTGKFYFYDGKIEGGERALYDTITEFEENTELNYNEDETILTLSTTITPEAQIETTKYNTLQEAINAVGNNQTTIELLRNVEYTKNNSVITIPSNKNIVLDLKGYKISSSIPEKVIENNGTLEITDTSTGQTGTIVTSEEKTITNANGANLIISGGIIDNRDNQAAIYNEGFVEISGGEIAASDNGIYNNRTGSIEMTGGTITGNSNSSSRGIYNNSTGSVEITGGTIRGVSRYASYGIYNANSGTIEMTGGTITDINYGIYNAQTGTIEVSGGTINSDYGDDNNYGIYNTSTGTIIVGNKENGEVSQVEPTILATNSSSYYVNVAYGIYNPNGTLNYYDGKIQGKTKAIYGNISKIEDLTKLNISFETININPPGVMDDYRDFEVVTLQKILNNVARVNGIEYDSIQKAVEACGTAENTIIILSDSDPGATIIIENNQNITIDLNGYIINNYTELKNKGTLKITDNTSGQTGKIVGLTGIAISNSGTLELQGGAIADSGYGIQNIGKVIVNGGKVFNNTYGIYNDENGIITVETGTISSNTYGIYNYASNSTTDVNGGSITSNQYGIYNYNGTTNIFENGITNNDYGIYNTEGITTIKEGVEVQSNIGIYVAGGRVNIGETGTMNSNSPIIIGETYGLSVALTGTVYMYDGQIRGKTGATQGFITYTESGYAVANKVEGGYSIDYLALAGTISTVAEVNGISYSNLQSAINSVVGSEPQTIKLTNGIISDMTFNIAEGQNIILDMNEKTITSDLSVTINNAGNLTIIDSTGSGVGKISSTTGTAIVNSGTLTLGQDDGTVSQDLITIEGQTYGIETTGELNFYDGTINGGSAVSGTVTNRATGYVIRTTTVNGKERYYLST